VTYESILGLFLTNYGTVENYVRSYGGQVSIGEQDRKLPKNNEVHLQFNREIKFPRELLAEFDPTFQEIAP